MLSTKCNDYINEILSYVKYPFVHSAIKKEFSSHMDEKMDYYLEQGNNLDESSHLTIRDMGDAKEIGTALNKQHNPFWSWIHLVTNIIVIIFIMIALKTLVVFIDEKIIDDKQDRGITHGIVESGTNEFEIDKEITFEHTKICFTKMTYNHQNKEVRVYYKSYGTNFDLFGGFSMGFNIFDDKGKLYKPWTKSSNQKVVRNGVLIYYDFPEDSSTITISYDKFNREFQVEIPFKAGEASD